MISKYPLVIEANKRTFKFVLDTKSDLINLKDKSLLTNHKFVYVGPRLGLPTIGLILCIGTDNSSFYDTHF